MEVTVSNLAGEEVCVVQCAEKQTILAVKVMISEKIGMSFHRAVLLELSIDGRLLRNDEAMALVCQPRRGPVEMLVTQRESRIPALPEFVGLYIGIAREGRGTWVFELAIDAGEFKSETDRNAVEGVVHWRCTSGPQHADPQLRGRQWVQGFVLPDRSLQLSGVRSEPAKGLIYNASFSTVICVLRNVFLLIVTWHCETPPHQLLFYFFVFLRSAS
eukprot:TRINITY_DN38614_c0_g1_i8.p1 TRINITY_DN38614_c0_g1~~TRINITY_DN38614_c0_g1_i8.p1  ORF type:complete len:216 (+),score=24.64 TRINITY_DN38614_c0_g1_i8:84-731(+)